jgi:drug/metabolite transporter (DMT)-like permease
MAEQETVSPSEILQSTGADKPVTGGTWLQRTGVVLAAGVGALGAIVTLGLILKWMSVSPQLPVIAAGADVNVVKATLDNYKSLQQVVLEPYTTLFDSVVVKVLLPVFTTILGYIFGSQRNNREG